MPIKYRHQTPERIGPGAALAWDMEHARACAERDMPLVYRRPSLWERFKAWVRRMFRRVVS